MAQTPITVPLLNANEPEARLVDVHVADGQRVEAGAILFTIETTKAASDVEAPTVGFVRMLAAEGDTVSVGDLLAYLTETVDEALPTPAPVSVQPVDSLAGDLRITKPARALAEILGLHLDSLPTDRLLTEAAIREVAAARQPIDLPDYGSEHILIYGAGGHAKAVMEMVQAIGAHRIAGILDDNPALAGKSVLGISVLGGRGLLALLREKGLMLAANGVGGILDIAVRVRLFELQESAGFSFPALAHPRATVEASASISDGVQVFANAYVGSSALLHPRCMVNTGAIVSHDCEIGRYTHIAPGAMLAGHVHVGERSLVGMGVTTAIGIKIGNGVRIGNGAVVYADVPDKTIVPAGKVWAGG
ncbi:MAG: NeuD/PglB/VioB family sugar acetyltransferase [Anaerolineae bacterium]|nr:NeuD/PglB/VioB family sugar acetyltransferase [Anaerolineae bacterium]